MAALVSQGQETDHPLEMFMNEAAKFLGLDDLGACCYRPVIPQRAKPGNANRFKLPPPRSCLKVGATPEAEAQPAVHSLTPPLVVAEEARAGAGGDDDDDDVGDDSFSFSSSLRNYELPDEDLDNISLETLGRVYAAFVAQSRPRDLSIFMETTFYALCYVGSDGALEPMVDRDVLPRVMNATQPLSKLSRTEVRAQAVLLANDCKVTW